MKMVPLFAGHGFERRLLSAGSLRSPTPFLIGIMAFALVLISAAGLALANAAGLVREGSQHGYVVQLPDGREGRLETAVRVLRSTEGVRQVQPVPEAEMRETLERWLGPGDLGDELPVPALVHFDLASGADPGAVSAALERSVPGARLVAESATLQPLLSSLRVLQWVVLVLVLLLAAASSAAVVLAARGALDTHRRTVEIMHGVGATDRQIARLFQRRIASDALAGSLAGGALAAFALLLLGSVGASLAGDLAGRAPLGTADLLLLGLIPLAVVALATLVARIAVLRALREAL